MLAEGRLIVEDATCAHSSVHTLRVHHREFPEIRAEAGSLAEGITHLIAQLKCAREHVGSQWHRDLMDRAIVEATESLDTLIEAGQDNETSCVCISHIPDQIEPVLPERGSSI